MPIITTPSGRKLRVPDGASQEQIMAVLQASGELPEAGGGPPPAPGAVPAAPASLGGPRAADPASGTGPDLPGPPAPSGAVAQRPFGTLFQHQIPKVDTAHEVDPTTQGTRWQNLAAGLYSGALSTARGIEQARERIMESYLGGRAEEIGDTPEYRHQLQQAEADQREQDAALLSTGAGRLGQMGAVAGSYAVPGLGATRAANILTKGLGFTRQLPAMMAAGAAEGGITGYALPVTEGEDPLANAAFGAKIGGILPAAVLGGGKILQSTARPAGWLGRKLAPGGVTDIYDAVSNPLRSRAARKEAEKAAAQAAEDAAHTTKTRAEGRRDVSNIYDELSVPHASMGRALREHVADFGKDVPAVLRNKIDKALGGPYTPPAPPPKPPKPPKEPKPKVEKLPKPPKAPKPAPEKPADVVPFTGKQAKDTGATGKEVEQLILRAKGQQKTFHPRKEPKNIHAPMPVTITGAVRKGANDPFKSKGAELTQGIGKKDVDDLVEEQIAAARKRYGADYDKPLGHSRGASHLEGASQADFDREFFRREYRHGDPTGDPASLSGASAKDFRAEYARRQHLQKTGERTTLKPEQERPKYLPPPLAKPHPGPTAIGGPRNTNKSAAKEARRQRTAPFRDEARGHIDPLEKARQSRESARGRLSVADEIDLAEGAPAPTRYQPIGPRLSKEERRYRKNEGMQKLNPQDPKEFEFGMDENPSWEEILTAEKKKQRYWAGRPMNKFPQGGGGKPSVDILTKMQGTRKHANLSDEYHEAVGDWDNKVLAWQQGGKQGPKPELPVKYRYEKMHHDQYWSARNRAGADPDLPGRTKTMAQKRADLLRERSGEYTAARLTSKHQRVNLPKDKPHTYYRGQPRPLAGPKVGPEIKGRDIDDMLKLVEADNSKGIKGEGMNRLRGILEGAQEHMTPDQKARLAKAAARALRGDKLKRGANIKYSPGRSTFRAILDQYRDRSEEDGED